MRAKEWKKENAGEAHAERENSVLYLCDRRTCVRCSNPMGKRDGCRHTTDIRHAENFSLRPDGGFSEKQAEREKTEGHVFTKYGTFTEREWSAIERYVAVKTCLENGIEPEP